MGSLPALCRAKDRHTANLKPSEDESLLLIMARGNAIRFVLLAGLCALLSTPPMRAQVPRRLEKCLPCPTLAQEIQDMRDEIDQLERYPIILDSVRIEGGEGLSAS